MMWILILIASATACIMMLSAHVPCIDILDKYYSDDDSTLLSINRSGLQYVLNTERLKL